MRSLWTIITVLALANLLAILGFVGWLKMNDRLSADRVERIRVMLAETVAAEQSRSAEDAKKAEDSAAVAAAERDAAQPPINAESRIELARGEDEIVRLRAERVQRENSDLTKTLLSERAELDRQMAEFKKERDEFNRMRDELAKQEGGEQFEKAVKLYQSVKPTQAKDMMKTLITKGETEQVVSYLNAIPPRTASKIVGAFHTDDPTLAADLLERLRKRGLELPPPGT